MDFKIQWPKKSQEKVSAVTADDLPCFKSPATQTKTAFTNEH
jgi:hypothetical protein